MNWADFYLICFVVGFALSLIMLFGGMGHFHLSAKWLLPHWGHAGVHPAPVGHGSAGGHSGVAGQHARAGRGAAQASPFDAPTIMAFLAWFGGTGYLLTRYSDIWSLLAFGLALLGGLAGAAIVFGFLVKVLLAHETVLDPSDFEMVGVLGKVNNGIRAGGTGEIIFSQGGVRRPSGARSEDGLAIPKGSEVVVTRYERGIAYVRLWDDLARESSKKIHPRNGEEEEGAGSGERK